MLDGLAVGRDRVTIDADEDLLPRAALDLIEERWWRPIEAQSSIDVLRHDDGFVEAPVDHPALFADHGVVHVRNIAANALSLATAANGLLLARRPPDRQQFLTGVALLTVYLHDIGMVDATPIGRRVHALVAAQHPFMATADDIVGQIIGHRGIIVRRLEAVDAVAPFDESLDVILRELMSLAVAHSKSTVPIALFSQPAALRRLVQACVFTSLDEHRARETTPLAPRSDADVRFEVNLDHYDDPHASYSWMVSDHAVHRALVHDVIDGLRVLRAADAIRQRGASLRTAAGYEIFVDSTGYAVYALREPGNTAVHLLRVDSPIAAGEANLRAAMVTADGHLRLALHRGTFDDERARTRAVCATSDVIGDIALDVLPTFDDVAVGDLSAPDRVDPMRVLVERPSDDPSFADDVVGRLVQHWPELTGRVDAVAGVDGADSIERRRYHAATPVAANSELAAAILIGAAERGANVGDLDRSRAFTDVRVARVTAHEIVIADGSPPVFVYLPGDDGLFVHPVGGYSPEPVPAWFPLGVTGAVRRAERNATVIAHADLMVVMVPSEVYTAEWFKPLTAEDFANLFRREVRP